MTAQETFFATSITGLALQSHLFDALCSFDTDPHAGRFGSHYFLFPLLHVNKHFRAAVAKYLFALVYGRKHADLQDKEIQIEPHLKIQRFQMWNEGTNAMNDPRFNLSSKSVGKMQGAELHMLADKLDTSSVELNVIFNKSNNALNVISQEILDEDYIGLGLCYPTSLTIISTAAFEFGREKGQAAHGRSGAAAERFGLRSAVPLPVNKFINVEEGFHVQWPRTEAPEPVNGLEDEWEGLRLTYLAKSHDFEDFKAEEKDKFEMALDVVSEFEEEEGDSYHRVEFVYNEDKEAFEAPTEDHKMKRVAIRFNEIKAPLLGLLRPRVTTLEELKESYEYSCWQNGQEDMV